MINDPLTGLIDLHSHILPGVDDGASGIEESLEMLRLEQEQGVTDVVLTPHSGITVLDEIDRVYENLVQAVNKSDLRIRIWQGMEVYIPCGIFNSKSAVRVKTIGSSNRILAEFNTGVTADELFDVVGKIRNEGLDVVLAHPERYKKVAINDILKLSADNVKIQVNSPSLAGLGSEIEHKRAVAIVKAGLMDYMGSDAHNTSRRYPVMDKGYKVLIDLVGKDMADMICITNPASLLGIDTGNK